MKILFLLQDIPYPPTEGIRLKAFNLIRLLALNNECHILSLGDGDQERAKLFEIAVPNIKVIGIVDSSASQSYVAYYKIFNLIRALPPSFATFRNVKFRELFEVAVRENKYDVIHYDIINMAQYYSMATNVPSVHSPNDATSLSYARKSRQESRYLSVTRLRYWISGCLMRAFERKYYEKFTVVHVVSIVDQQYLKNLNSRINVVVAPLVVEERYFSVANSLQKSGGSCSIITFVGDLAIQGIVNGLIDFIDHAYNKILENNSNVRFRVLGRNASPKVKKYLRSHSNIEYYTWVDDFVEFMKDSQIVIIPDKAGTGVKNRVLQAMAMGLPVVGTTCAFEGIEMENNVHGLIRSTPKEFCDAVLYLLGSESIQRQIGVAATLLVREKYSEDVVSEVYEKMYERAKQIGRDNTLVLGQSPPILN